MPLFGAVCPLRTLRVLRSIVHIHAIPENGVCNLEHFSELCKSNYISANQREDWSDQGVTQELLNSLFHEFLLAILEEVQLAKFYYSSPNVAPTTNSTLDDANNLFK